MKILLASGNKHKKKEIQEILKIENLYYLNDVKNLNIIEDGATFAENAYIKALETFKVYGKEYIILADDSGLVIPALSDILGVHTARYLEGKDQDYKNDSVIEKIKGLDRTAYFCCCAILLKDKDDFVINSAILKGEIAKAKDNTGGGFGYDPIFLHKGQYLSRLNKNEISHRAKAFNIFKKLTLF